jgi:hypothetical protein
MDAVIVKFWPSVMFIGPVFTVLKIIPFAVGPDVLVTPAVTGIVELLDRSVYVVFVSATFSVIFVAFVYKVKVGCATGTLSMTA